jgi:hypothetical protein
LLALVVPALAVAACSNVSADSATGSILYHGPGPSPDAGDAAPMLTANSDAGAAPASQGSPLCNAPLTGSVCYPDNPTTAKACGEAPDGGAYNATAGYDNETLACRVVATSPDANGATQGPRCAVAGTAGDGSWCKSSDECQAAYDCVGAGTCQRYCCSGNSECLADEFCDIQPTTQATAIQIPVCMPIHPAPPAPPCQLLDPTSCPATFTCAVVRDDGTTSCVAVGDAKAQEECDTQHCQAGLVCLGAPGSRVCYQLCSTETAQQCSGTQQCNGGLPLFPDPGVGICQ